MWIHKIAGIAIISALLSLPLLHIVLLDSSHDHIQDNHHENLVSEMVHEHEDTEKSEHDNPQNIALHIGYHTLLNVFLDTSSEPVNVSVNYASVFNLPNNQIAMSRTFAPPVPPPLA